MKYGFDTERDDAAVAAALIYNIYGSRDVARFKIRLDMWNRIERWVKAEAKRADTLPYFVERLMPRLCCESLRPLRGDVPAAPGAPRDFAGMTALLGAPAADPITVLRTLYRETSLCVLLVRERLERDKAAREAAKASGAADDDEDDLLAAA